MILTLSILILSLVLLTAGLIKRDGNTRRIVPNEELKGKTVVFYREDCAACQRVYSRLWLRQKIVQDSVFVNMNQQKNRHYIQEYQLTKVPTIVHNGNYVEKYEVEN